MSQQNKTQTEQIKKAITQELWDIFEKETDSDEGWYVELKDKHATFCSKTLFPKCDMYAYKVSSTINFPVHIFKEMYDDHSIRAEYNSDIIKCSKFYEDGNFDIIYQISQPPVSFLSERELVLAREWKHYDDGFDIICTSMEHDDYPIQNGLTRSEVAFQTSRVRKNKQEPDSKSDVTFIYQINLGMWIPGWVISQAISLFSSKMIGKIESACQFHIDRMNKTENLKK
eukprot:gene3803-6964_t